jgi:eukaryotic-like serine/threonine-protein kinase
MKTLVREALVPAEPESRQAEGDVRSKRASDPRPLAPPLSSDPLSGTSYRTVMLLGQGNMGLVVEAEHLTLGTVVVIKLLHEGLVHRPDFVDRMRVEAQSLGALARLKHPNIVVVTDFAVTPRGVPFLVMERLFGQTVAEERRRRGALPLEEAIEIAEQTLAGLAAVHQAGIVHRDIKAGNLFLCDATPPERRVVKLLDFGIAKVLASAPAGRAPRPLRFPTGEGITVGTPCCLSPEQARGLPVDARTDLYAVGVLLYTLVVGKGPFDGVRGSVDLLHAHASIVPPAPSARATQPIPAPLDAVILQALAKRPEDRFATAEEFSATLREVARPSGRAPSAKAQRFDTEPLPPRRFDTEPLPEGGIPQSCAPSASSPWALPIAEDTETTVRSVSVPSSRARASARQLLVLALVWLGWTVFCVLLYWALRSR